MNAQTTAHPTDQTLSDYGLGRLDDATAERVNAHLESCKACQRRTAEISPDSFLARFREGQASDASTSRPSRSSSQSRAGSTVAPEDETLPPELANHKDYEVVRELGRGGMGVVYLVRNRLMERQEVLKVMARHLMERREVSERFLREIRAVASLKHPNIVSAHHAFHVGGSIAFTMEYVDGHDLSKMVKARGPLPVPHACLFAQQVALGLQYAHEEGMVHRDIKPGNLMVTRRGTKATVKILDFGLAKAAREGTFDSALTHAGQMLGTPDFIAPEQSVDAQKADIRADIYSLGCTLYYLLSGGPPFHATSLYDLLQAHHSMDARLLNLLRPEVPTELAALVAKMMAKEPQHRFQTPGEVASALAPFFKKGGIVSESPKLQVSLHDIPRPVPAPSGSLSTESLPPRPSSRPEEQWASLIDLREPEALVIKPPKKPAVRASASPGRRWLWPSVAVGMLLIGCAVALLPGIFKAKMPHGTIVVEGLPVEAEILVDGNAVKVTPVKGGEPLDITVEPGSYRLDVSKGDRHRLVVRRGGVTLKSDEVTIALNDEEAITIRLEEPKPDSAPTTKLADAGTIRPEEPKTDPAPTPKPVDIGSIRPEEPKPDPAPTSRLADAGSSATPPPKATTGGADSASSPSEASTGRASATPRIEDGPEGQPILENALGMKLVRIRSGTFRMGFDPNDPYVSEYDRIHHRFHDVKISRDFYMGVHEVTQEQYSRLAGPTNPSKFKSGGGKLPVENVTWLDAILYCNELSKEEGLPPFYAIEGRQVIVYNWGASGYRLPTSAEWEFACRGGKSTRYSFGNDPARLGRFAWFDGNAEGHTHPVGTKPANPLGLYDMHGNVWEWCWDYPEEYGKRALTTEDPRGPVFGGPHMFRGGCWESPAVQLRSAHLGWAGGEDYRASHVGFRVVRNAESVQKSANDADSTATPSETGAGAIRPRLTPEGQRLPRSSPAGTRRGDRG